MNSEELEKTKERIANDPALQRQQEISKDPKFHTDVLMKANELVKSAEEVGNKWPDATPGYPEFLTIFSALAIVMEGTLQPGTELTVIEQMLPSQMELVRQLRREQENADGDPD